MPVNIENLLSSDLLSRTDETCTHQTSKPSIIPLLDCIKNQSNLEMDFSERLAMEMAGTMLVVVVARDHTSRLLSDNF